MDRRLYKKIMYKQVKTFIGIHRFDSDPKFIEHIILYKKWLKRGKRVIDCEKTKRYNLNRDKEFWRLLL